MKINRGRRRGAQSKVFNGKNLFPNLLDFTWIWIKGLNIALFLGGLGGLYPIKFWIYQSGKMIRSYLIPA
jgi:hypothetical protein